MSEKVIGIINPVFSDLHSYGLFFPPLSFAQSVAPNTEPSTASQQQNNQTNSSLVIVTFRCIDAKTSLPVDAFITIYGGSTNLKKEVDSNGFLSILLPSTVYEISVGSNGYETQYTQILINGNPHDLNFSLTKIGD